jgi:hypothetical protein
MGLADGASVACAQPRGFESSATGRVDGDLARYANWLNGVDARSASASRSTSKRKQGMTKSLKTVELAASLLLLASAIPTTSALAAPFCVQTEVIPPQCIYYDPNSCRARANAMSGWCVVNPEEVATPHGTGEYCRYSSSLAVSCDYGDVLNCSRDAARTGGVCVQSPPSGPTNTPNPFQYLQPPAG